MSLRKRCWIALGSLALMTGRILASEPHAGAASGSLSANQHVANEIATAIGREVSDPGYTVRLDFRSGTATLRGSVASEKQMSRIVEVARSHGSVQKVVNEMKVARANPIQTVAKQDAAPQIQLVPPPTEMAHPGQQSHAGPATPEYRFPSGAAPQYDMPFMPHYAWPAKAPYPNYTAVQYPKKYPMSSWPYIGPFYPYPEAPLDWREVKAYTHTGLRPFHLGPQPPSEWQRINLRLEDGHWYLGFKEAWWNRCNVFEKIGNLKYNEDPAPIGCGPCCEGTYKVKFKPVLFTHLYTN